MQIQKRNPDVALSSTHDSYDNNEEDGSSCDPRSPTAPLSPRSGLALSSLSRAQQPFSQWKIARGHVAKAPFTRKRFWLKKQTFPYGYMFRLHENSENANKNARKCFHFENAIQSGNFWKRNNETQRKRRKHKCWKMQRFQLGTGRMSQMNYSYSKRNMTFMWLRSSVRLLYSNFDLR